jgi:hypothetical protein
MKIFSYPVYGLLLLGGLAAGQWYGLSATSYAEVKNVPKSVRENPGVYRSHYGFLPRWFGGK